MNSTKKLVLSFALLTMLAFDQAIYPASPTLQPRLPDKADTLYNNAKLIFHAIGPKVHSLKLEGIDPSQSIEVMEFTLGQFVDEKQDLSAEMRDCILKIRKSLLNAQSRYLSCIKLVNSSDESTVNRIALELSQDVKILADTPSHPSVLFIGGHYLHPKGGSLGGHTASYEVIRQDDGKLSFLINNTVKIEKHHEINGNRIRQLVYTDLEAADLDRDFWTNVIQTNFMNPVRGSVLMDSFYDYVDTKLLKASNNKTVSRSFKCQEVGVCAWKSLSVWLHGKISQCNCKENEDPFHESIYVQFKKFMFTKMLANFMPTEQFTATIRIGKNGDGAVFYGHSAAEYLKNELQQKIVKRDCII